MDKISDEKVRQEILLEQNNMVVTAPAGTGKTFLIIKKIQNLLQIKNNFKKFAVITFTNRATNEVKNRIDYYSIPYSQINLIKIKTMDKWVLEEVIRPFYSNCFPITTNNPITPCFNETLKNYDKGIEMFKKTGILFQYVNNPKKSFIFDLALNILKKVL